MKSIKYLLIILFLLCNNATACHNDCEIDNHFINKMKNLSTVAIFAPYISLLGYVAQAKDAKSLATLFIVPGLTMGMYEFGCKNKHDLNFMFASGLALD